jgi:hypothetical protein
MFDRVLWQSRQLFSPPPSMRAGADLRPPSIFYSSLNRRSQFTPEPACHCARLHRIGNCAHTLVNVIASGALECSNVKAGRTRGDPRQHRYRFALWTWWPVKRAHDAVPCIRREHYRTLSHRVDAREGPVMEPACSSTFQSCWSIQLTSQTIHRFKLRTIALKCGRHRRPLCSALRTQVGHRAMSEKCQVRTCGNRLRQQCTSA